MARGACLVLKALLRESDFDSYAEMCGDAEVMRYIGDGQPLARPMAWRNRSTAWAFQGEMAKQDLCGSASRPCHLNA